MQQLLLIVHVLVCIGVVVLVLIQHGKGADTGAAFGGGASGSMFGSRGPTTFLTRATTVLVAIFFITSLSLAWLATLSIERRSVIERVDAPLANDDIEISIETMQTGEGDSIALPELPSTQSQSQDN